MKKPSFFVHFIETTVCALRYKMAVHNHGLSFDDAKTNTYPLENLIVDAPPASQNILRSYAGARLWHHKEERAIVTKALHQHGYDKFTLLAEGGFALVLNCGDGNVARIIHSRSEDMRYTAQSVLQPKKVISAGDYRIEILEKVEIGKATNEELANLKNRAWKEGLFVWDPTSFFSKSLRANVGKTSEGDVVFVDGDYLAKRPFANVKRGEYTNPDCQKEEARMNQPNELPVEAASNLGCESKTLYTQHVENSRILPTLKR